MSKLRCLAAAAVSLILANCAIRPLPDQVTGISTYNIVRQIRCETRQAVIDLAIYWLVHNKYDPQARQVGYEFDNGALSIDHLNPGYLQSRNVSERVYRISSLFFNTGIAYNYQLDMKEADGLAAGQLRFLRPFSDGNYTLGLGGEFNLYRQNIRGFTVTDTFKNLIHKVPQEYCNGKVVQANHVYPIAGRIGMREMIHQFIEMTLFTGLSDTGGKGPPTMTDMLHFYTFVGGGATPSFFFTPVTGAWHLVSGSVTGGISRTDLHSVTIGLAVDTGDVPKVAPLRGLLFGPLVTARTTTSTEATAVDAVNQALTLQIFRSNVLIGR